MADEKDIGGRPPLFDSEEKLQLAIDEYFTNLDKEEPTITGLALYLGFESRQSFYDYEKIDKFSYTIKRARLRIESNYEQWLFSRNPTGSIFALKNLGWKDKTETEHSGEMTVKNITGMEVK